MVPDTGKTLHADTLKPVNLPEPVMVREDTAQPAAIQLNRRWLAVERVAESWRLDDEWWRPRPLARRYYAVILSGGRRLTVFKDLTDGRWYYQSY